MLLSSIPFSIIIFISILNLINAENDAYKNRNDYNQTLYNNHRKIISRQQIDTINSVQKYKNNNRYTNSPSLLGSYFKLKGKVNERLGKITDNVISEGKILIRSTINDLFNMIGEIENGPTNSSAGTITGTNSHSNTSSTPGNNKKKPPETVQQCFVGYTDAKGNKQRIDLCGIVKKSNLPISNGDLETLRNTIEQIQNIADLEKDLYNINELYKRTKALEFEMDSDEDLEIFSKLQSRLSSKAQRMDFTDAVLSVKHIASKLDNLKQLDSIQSKDITESVMILSSGITAIDNLKDINSIVSWLLDDFTNAKPGEIDPNIRKIEDYVDIVDIAMIINTDMSNIDDVNDLRESMGDAKLRRLWGQMYHEGLDSLHGVSFVPMVDAPGLVVHPEFDRWAKPFKEAIDFKNGDVRADTQFANVIYYIKTDEFGDALSGLEELINSAKPEDDIKNLDELSKLKNKIPVIQKSWDQIKEFGDEPKSTEDLINALDRLKKLQDNLNSADNYKDVLQMFSRISAKPRVLDQFKEVMRLLEKIDRVIINNPGLTGFTKKLDEALKVMSSDESITKFRKNVADLKIQTKITESMPNLNQKLKRVEEILNNKGFRNFINTLQRVKQAVSVPTELMQFRQLLGTVKKVAKSIKDAGHFESTLKGVKRLSEVESAVANLDDTLAYVRSSSLSAEKIDAKKKMIAEIQKMQKIFNDHENLSEKLYELDVTFDDKVERYKQVLGKVKMIKDVPERETDILMAISTLKTKSIEEWLELWSRFDDLSVPDSKILEYPNYKELYTRNHVGLLEEKLNMDYFEV